MIYESDAEGARSTVPGSKIEVFCLAEECHQYCRNISLMSYNIDEPSALKNLNDLLKKLENQASEEVRTLSEGIPERLADQ